MTTLPPEDPNVPGERAGTPGPSQDPAVPPAPSAQQPPQAPQQPSQQQYQAPPQQQYQAPPQGGYQQPATDPVSTITLNYWLSVFFTWIPALIFFIIEKDKGNPQAYAYHRDNLNFSLVRTIAYVAIIVIGLIPYIGWLIAILLWLAQIVLFVFHIIAAAKAPENYRNGAPPGFIFNISMVK